MSLDLSHLQKHVVRYIQPATNKDPGRVYDVDISYSDHCYTKRLNDSERRVFDAARYELSKQLPQIVSELMTRECHHIDRTSFFTVDIDEHRSYEVYFKVLKKGKGLFLHVQSAYIRDEDMQDKKPTKSKIRFQIILYNVLHNKPIRKK